MKAKIVSGRPPNFRAITAVFPLARKPGVIFAFADTIFISSGNLDLPDWLIAHETKHLERQQWSVEGALIWWSKYLEDVSFRYNEELLGHREEYLFKIQNASRPRRRAALRETAKRLTNPLYKFPVTLKQAMNHIAGEENV